jgi:hypothetical protein
VIIDIVRSELVVIATSVLELRASRAAGKVKPGVPALIDWKKEKGVEDAHPVGIALARRGMCRAS